MTERWAYDRDGSEAEGFKLWTLDDLDMPHELVGTLWRAEDARLIENAPKLLEALELAEDGASHAVRFGHGDINTLALIREAIGAARGRS